MSTPVSARTDGPAGLLLGAPLNDVGLPWSGPPTGTAGRQAWRWASTSSRPPSPARPPRWPPTWTRATRLAPGTNVTTDYYAAVVYAVLHPDKGWVYRVTVDLSVLELDSDFESLLPGESYACPRARIVEAYRLPHSMVDSIRERVRVLAAREQRGGAR